MARQNLSRRCRLHEKRRRHVTWNPLRHALNNEGATHDAWGLWSAILAVLLLSFNVSTVEASRGDNSEVAKDAGVRTVTLFRKTRSSRISETTPARPAERRTV